MIIQVDGKTITRIEVDVLRSVIIPGKICNLITREPDPEKIITVEQEDGEPVKINRYGKMFFATVGNPKSEK